MDRKDILNIAWKKRLELRAEGAKLLMEGDKLWNEGNKSIRANNKFLAAKPYKLCAEGQKLQHEGYKLWEEGNIIWAEAVLKNCGNINFEWKNYDLDKNSFECHLETGEVFKP